MCRIRDADHLATLNGRDEIKGAHLVVIFCELSGIRDNSHHQGRLVIRGAVQMSSGRERGGMGFPG